MTVSAQLNKLTKKDLEDICTQNNVEIPKSAKTKKDLVTFMEGYTQWPTPLEDLLGSSAPKPAAKVAVPKATAGVDTKIVEDMQKEVKDLHFKLNTISEVLAKVTEDMKLFQAGLEAVNSPKPSNSVSIKRIREIDMQVAEAILEDEWTPLDDVKDLLEDISEEEFLESLRYLLAVGAIQGEEEGSELQVELLDGTMIGKVKK